jgi:hypothetical protein
MRCRYVYCTLALLGMLASAVSGQPANEPKGKPTPQELEQAREYFKAAEAARKQGDYQMAIEKYIATYRLFPDPEFFFDIGEVCRLVGDDGRALRYFQKYLELDPNGRGSAAAHTAVDELRRSIDAKSAPGRSATVDAVGKPDEKVRREELTAKSVRHSAVAGKSGDEGVKQEPKRVPAAPSPLPRVHAGGPITPSSPLPSPVTTANPVSATTTARSWHWYDDKLGDGIAFGGVVVAGLGLIEYARARGDIDSAGRASDYAESQRLADSAYRESTISVGLAVGGGALVITGLLHILHASAPGESTVSVVPANRGGMVTYEATF